jgi:hypothetical protein
VDLRDAAHLAREKQAAFIGDFTDPAALCLLRKRIETPGDAFGERPRLCFLNQHFRIQCTSDRSLLNNESRIATM